MTGRRHVPRPSPDGLDAPFWEALKRHEIAIQRCAACLRFQWGPEVLCHRCLSREVGWAAVEPVGTVYSWERVWHPTMPSFALPCPYVIVLVELDHADGARLVGNLVGTDEPVIGMPVAAVFEDHEVDGEAFTLAHWKPR